MYKINGTIILKNGAELTDALFDYEWITQFKDGRVVAMLVFEIENVEGSAAKIAEEFEGNMPGNAEMVAPQMLQQVILSMDGKFEVDTGQGQGKSK